MKCNRLLLVAVLGFSNVLGYFTAFDNASMLIAADEKKLDRTILPIPEPDYPHSTVLDARNDKAPPRFEVKAPDNAPNVLIVLIDDMGFGMPSAFGGPIHMPTLDRLSKQGLRYNQFHLGI